MKPVVSLAVVLVGIPEQKFCSWPPDRSFRLLSEDARALRRRAIKGVGVEVQRGLFVQVARRLDALALEHSGSNQLRMTGLEAEAWLDLDEVLVRVEIPTLIRQVTTPPQTPPPAPQRSLWSKIMGVFGGAKEAQGTGVTAPVPRQPVRPVLGEQVLFAGTEVDTWHSVLSVLDAERVRSASPIWQCVNAARAGSLLERTAQFFAQAKRERSAVVQVLHDAVAA